jgi:hypothetical protein
LKSKSPATGVLHSQKPSARRAKKMIVKKKEKEKKLKGKTYYKFGKRWFGERRVNVVTNLS